MNNSYRRFVGWRFFTAGAGHNRLASFISVLAISGLVLGVALLIIVLSVMNGFDREMRTRILGVVPHLQIVTDHGIDDWPTLAADLTIYPAVAAAVPITQVGGIINFRGRTQAIQLRGVLQAPSEGDTQTVREVDLADNTLVLPRQLAARLGVAIGQKVAFIAPSASLSDRNANALPKVTSLTVTALYSTHTAVDAHLGLVSLPTAGDLAGLGGAVQGVRVTVTDVFAARQVGYQLMRSLPPDYRFTDWLQTHGNLYQAIQMSRKLVGLLVFLIIAIAAFNVVAMLVMSVVDKRAGIAILKTQGASSRDIMLIFLFQGSLIGLYGVLFGVLLGSIGALWVSDLVYWLEGLLQTQFLNLDIYPIDYVPTDLRAVDVLRIVAVALALNFAATLFPAWQASRVQPAQILRYE